MPRPPTLGENSLSSRLPRSDFNSIEALLKVHHRRVEELLESKFSVLLPLEDLKIRRRSASKENCKNPEATGQLLSETQDTAAGGEEPAQMSMSQESAPRRQDTPQSDASLTTSAHLKKSQSSMWNLTEKPEEDEERKGNADLVLQEDDIIDELEQASEAVANHRRSKAKEPKTIMQRIVNHYSFEIVMGSFILMNLVLIIINLEYMGAVNGVVLGMREDIGAWQAIRDVVVFLEHGLNAVFALELVMRFLADGPRIVRNKTILFDCIIVGTSVLEYIGSAFRLSFLRSFRLLKLVKLLRAFEAASFFSELRILLRTCVNSIMALFWSCILLFSIMVLGGLLLAQTCAGMIDDASYAMEVRVWTYMHYGSAIRAVYTLFEATMSGGWPNYARKMIEEVNVLYGFWWVGYVSVVIFAVMRVVTALFIQKTMSMAQADEELMLLEKLKEKEEMLIAFRGFLFECDTDGDGEMNRAELQELLKDVTLQYWLERIGIEKHELVGLFNVLDEGGGVVSHEDIIGGVMRISNGVRAVDSVVMMHEQRKIGKKVSEVHRYVTELMEHI